MSMTKIRKESFLSISEVSKKWIKIQFEIQGILISRLKNIVVNLVVIFLHWFKYVARVRDGLEAMELLNSFSFPLDLIPQNKNRKPVKLSK